MKKGNFRKIDKHLCNMFAIYYGYKRQCIYDNGSIPEH